MSSVVSHQSSRTSNLGHLDPVLMIFFTAVAAGLALIWPIVSALFNNRAIQQWHWISLGVGVVLLAGCAWFLVREHRN